MTEPWLLIDVSNMAYRALYTTGDLSYGGEATGVLYGIFRDIIQFCDLFGTHRIAFCFDGGIDFRLNIFDGYKAARKQRRLECDDEEMAARREFRRQLYRLRTKHLPAAGFRNVFYQEGYEADDILAAIVEQHLKEEFVVVSSDQDLYQLLSGSRVIIYNPMSNKSISQQWFEEQFGIGPSMWAHVKAIAGCSGDDVPGIKGVGEKTAAKYLAGTLKNTTKAWQSINSNNPLIERNLTLTRLPAPGCGPFELHDDVADGAAWDRLMIGLGMKSLVGRRGQHG